MSRFATWELDFFLFFQIYFENNLILVKILGMQVGNLEYNEKVEKFDMVYVLDISL